MRRYEIFPSCVIFAVMKHAIELFSELGRRLERLGEDAARPHRLHKKLVRG